MRAMSNTINRLGALRTRRTHTPSPVKAGALQRMCDFGTNPGRLSAWCHVPAGLVPGAGLVVVLHGCTQDAGGFDRGTGWSQLADEYGFCVLLPEQRRANNFNLCFNWYEPGNSRRGAGEPLSIVQMVDTMITQHGIDPAKVFVTGLSAGGAMTSVMLATYPEKFAGGAIVAGLPFGSASNIPEAFDRMRGHGGPNATTLANAIRKASPQRCDWPSVAVWHGTADAIVDVSNGRTNIEQWRRVHGAPVAPDVIGTVDGYPHRAWHDAAGRLVLEEYLITGMGHGTPVATVGPDACGAAGPYMLDVAISSTRHIAAAWGLTVNGRKPTVLAAPAQPAAANDELAPTKTSNYVSEVIDNALRAAGLMS